MNILLLLILVSSVSCLIPTVMCESNFNMESLTVQFYPNPRRVYDPGFVEMLEMLEAISTRFKSIFIPDIGAKTNNWSSKDNDKVSLVPAAVAVLNKKLKNTALTVAIGIRIKNKPSDEWELRNAIEATKNANKVYPGTVTNLFVNVHHVILNLTDELNWFSKLEQAVKLENLSMTLGLQPHRCLKYIQTENLGTHFTNLLVDPDVLLKIDFIVCYIIPQSTANEDQDYDASYGKAVVNLLYDIEIGLIKIFPNSEIVILTNWASYGKGEYKLRHTVQNMVSYWQYINDWGQKTQHLVFMEAAFDDQYILESNFSHNYRGWWEMVRGKSPPFREKISRLNAMDEHIEDSHYSLIIIVCSIVLFSLIVISIVVLIFYFQPRRRGQTEILTAKDISNFKIGFNVESLEAIDADYVLELPYDNSFELSHKLVIIERRKVLGKGEFGKVYNGQIKGGRHIAVKLTYKNVSPNLYNSLLCEIKGIIHIGKHKNVVEIIGADTSEIKSGKVYTFLELCEFGSLEKRLRSFLTKTTIESDSDGNAGFQKSSHFEKLTNWAFQISSGMEHIAQKKVIHGDLGTRNVLLNIHDVAKITDFGKSRRLLQLKNNLESNLEPAHWQWMAIEVLADMNFSTKSDVWSYAVTTWEIYSHGLVPYEGLKWWTNLPQMLNLGLRLHQPKYATDEIFAKLTKCWDSNPQNRPDFTELKTFFYNTFNGIAPEEGYDEVMVSVTEE